MSSQSSQTVKESVTVAQTLPDPAAPRPAAASAENPSQNFASPADAPDAGGTTQDSTGRIRIGRYEIERLLGSGGFGQIFLARDSELDRLVAIKVPHRHVLSQPTHAELYLTEARVLASLDHPNIVPVHDVGRGDDGVPFVVSKFIEGRDLSAVLRTSGLGFEQSAQLCAAVAEALHHAHQRGLVHRDIKPANILLDETGKPHVVDFGLALKEEDFGRVRGIIGTPAYMSPEQARGEGHRIDGRSDIFSLGAVFYELLTRKRPFAAKGVDEVLRQVANDEVQPPRQINDAIPRELERICLKALAKRAAERYTTALDLAEDLRHFLASPSDRDRPERSAPIAADQISAAAGQTLPAFSTQGSEEHLLPIVPKGLRSFDEHDTDFFLELLPGPRDRDGIPDSIRFWKARIEESDPDKTFSVGLLYGPSGCGKSSLVKAGLLPRLPGQLLAVYVEATAVETEARLLNGLRKKCPALPESATLRDALAGLRRGQTLPPGSKVLLILDQFEQWLHAHGEVPNSELVESLRQCDGGRVQCLVMVRDDFWMAATRFMRQLEIPLKEGLNSAAVDLFDVKHARRVLATFGQAFGRLPDSPSDYTKDQQAFLDQAIAGLAENGKVISVRLALFAEMMKSRPWTAATWKEVGGTQGVGARFLDETFSAATAPPQHRLHQRAARLVLKALLPEAGANIKGNMRSYAELLEASGYASRPRHFADLIQILDSELRLITPTDPEGAADDDLSPSKAALGQKFFQLTHDYLVPSLRDWLTRKQKETRRGRAELRLAELAAAWNAKPERRHLPNWWEWAGITLLTSRAAWSEPQRKMMRIATRRHLRSALLIVLAFMLLSAGGTLIRHRINEQSNARYSAALVERLVDAQTSQVPGVVAELAAYRTWADPLLRERLHASPVNSRQRLHASLALLPVDSSQVGFLYEQLLAADPQDVGVLRTSLAPHRQVLCDRLWTVAEQPRKERESERLRAAYALAAYDPNAARWSNCSAPVVQQLVAENPIFLSLWMDGFKPARHQLLPALANIFRDRRPEQGPQRALATSILAGFASDQPALLANLLMDGDESQFTILLPLLEKQAEPTATTLASELKRELKPHWSDPPLSSAWQPPGAGAIKKIEAAHGILAERFAFCQTMPLDDALALVEELRPSGYRPIRFRPFSFDQALQASVVWTRDALDWKLDSGLPAAEVQPRQAEARKNSFQAVDVAGYLQGEVPRYAILWMKVAAPAQTELLLDLDEQQLEIHDLSLRGQAYWRTATTSLPHQDGGQRYAAIWSKPADRELPGPSDSTGSFYVGGEGNYAGDNNLGDLQVDVHISPAAPPLTSQVRYARQLAEAEAALAAQPEALGPRYLRAVARYYLGRNAEALQDFSWLISKSTAPVTDYYRYRAITYARLGQEKEAKQDLARYQELSTTAGRGAVVEAIVAAYLGTDEDGMQRLDTSIAAHANRPAVLFDASCAYAVASGHLADRDPTKAKLYAERALNLLQTAIAKGYQNYDQLQSNANLDALRGRPDFAALLEAGKLNRHYAAIWHPVPGLTSKEVHGLSPSEHLARCQQLIAEGYRPVSFSAAAVQNQTVPVTASVWQRPIVPDEQVEQLALRQAKAAVALLKLNQEQLVWPLLQHRPDPRLRSALVDGFHRLNVDPRKLIRRLQEEPDVAARRALLLALGHFAESAITPEEHAALLPDLLELYKTDPDPGIHSAVAWVLRRWNQAESLRQIDREFATGLATHPRQWYVNQQGQTLAVLKGPAEFLMGSPRSDKEREGGPTNHLETLHRQRIGRAFAIGAHEVTVEQFLRFRKNHQYPKEHAPAPDCPVTGVTWFDAAAYCNWLSEREGIPKTQWCYLPNPQGEYADGMILHADYLSQSGYRLPTEAEWEFACRAGATTSRPFGQTGNLLKHYAWHSENSQDRAMLPTGSLLPNDFGLFDMLGNAVEWTQDSPLYYAAGQGGQPSDDVQQPGPVTKNEFRVLRGGSFNIPAVFVRSAYRFRNLPELRFFVNGFRLARTMPAAP